jgi:hypothetical protein
MSVWVRAGFALSVLLLASSCKPRPGSEQPAPTPPEVRTILDELDRSDPKERLPEPRDFELPREVLEKKTVTAPAPGIDAQGAARLSALAALAAGGRDTSGLGTPEAAAAPPPDNDKGLATPSAAQPSPVAPRAPGPPPSPSASAQGTSVAVSPPSNGSDDTPAGRCARAVAGCDGTSSKTDICVRDIAPCGAPGAQPCCPEACLEEYKAQRRAEVPVAEAFRSALSSGSHACFAAK